MVLVAVPAAWTSVESAERAEAAPLLEPISVFGPPDRSIPASDHQRVERWIQAFQTTRTGEFERLMARRALFADMIREKLRARGMPEDLLYIAVIESGLYPHAVSRVSAVGMWQFMSPTALQYGLRLDEYVDERRDPIASTDAAIEYLAWLNDHFGGSWYLTLAAFNGGPGRVERIVRQHAAGEMTDASFWKIRPYLPRETRAYVPKMIAITQLGNATPMAASADGTFEPYRYDPVFVPGNTPLRRVARALDVPEKVIQDLNPHLIRGVTPPGEMYGVRVPEGSGAVVVAALSGRVSTARNAD